MSAAAVPAPNTLEALGVRRSLLEDLALKMIYLHGEISSQQLSEQMKISRSLAEELFIRLRKEQLCEVTGMSGSVPRMQTTSQGKSRALEALARNQYTGPTPVALEDYIAQVQWQTVRRFDVHPADIERAFGHLVIDPSILTQIGTAMTSGRAIFLYGATGSGKTTIAETLTSIFHRDLIWVPYAVEIDGQIITIFDSHLHERSNHSVPAGSDGRWVLCHRPKVVIGGELTVEMLDLQYNPLTKFYTAPIQMKANNGVLIIDDFGRQHMAPSELLNRWVVPLDRHIDFLQFAGGKKLEIPFDMFVVFATNMEISKLVDEAFLRRIQTKVRIDYVTPAQFHAIAANFCRARNLNCAAELMDYAIELITKRYRQPLRACYPADVINQVCWAAKYQGREPMLDREAIERACNNYFLLPSGNVG